MLWAYCPSYACLLKMHNGASLGCMMNIDDIMEACMLGHAAEAMVLPVLFNPIMASAGVFQPQPLAKQCRHHAAHQHLGILFFRDSVCIIGCYAAMCGNAAHVSL